MRFEGDTCGQSWVVSVLWGEEGAIVKRGDADVLRACV